MWPYNGIFGIRVEPCKTGGTHSAIHDLLRSYDSEHLFDKQVNSESCAVRYLARQPILTAQGHIFAYELLFRDGIQNFCAPVNGDFATNSLLDTSFLIGFNKLTGDARAFINCPRDFLLSDGVSVLPRNKVVLEILENDDPDDDLVAACHRLREEGYLLALDDFVDPSRWKRLLAITDFIKVDFRATTNAERQTLITQYGSRHICMLAEKIETLQEFSEAQATGFSLFQGYFFCQPEILQQRVISESKIAYLELLQASLRPEFDIELLASKIKHDASLTFRLLRYLNSVMFGLRTEIRSVSHALVLLGEKELRRWVMAVCLAVLGEGRPDELVRMPLIRARFCELIASMLTPRPPLEDSFLVGLLSTMGALLNEPLQNLLQELPIRLQIKESLLGNPGVYRDLLDLAIAHEQADWGTIASLVSTLGLREDMIAEQYISAVEWAMAVTSQIHTVTSR